jgi:hypothetical protein
MNLATDGHRFTQIHIAAFVCLFRNPCLKLVPFPLHSLLPIAALPSMSLIPFAPFIRVNPWLVFSCRDWA